MFKVVNFILYVFFNNNIKISLNKNPHLAQKLGCQEILYDFAVGSSRSHGKGSHTEVGATGQGLSPLHSLIQA